MHEGAFAGARTTCDKGDREAGAHQITHQLVFGQDFDGVFGLCLFGRPVNPIRGDGVIDTPRSW